MKPLELLRELVAIPSESGREEAVAALLKDVFQKCGWSPVMSGRNVHAVLGDAGPLLLLNSHTDTVPVGENWTKNPYGTELVAGRLYGRGANDAKGCLTAMICAAANVYKKNPPPGRVCVAATCEEEINGKGLETLIRSLPRPDAAVVGEPTGLNPAVAQKGLLILEVTAAGRSAHAAHGGGVNAIEAAASDVLALSKLSFDRAHPALGKPSLAVTQISGGTRHNVIPDSCKLVVDIRTTPNYEVDEIVASVTQAAKGSVHVRSQRLGAVATEESQPIVQAALAANPAGKAYGSPTLSDWVFLKGIPTVKAGPGDSKRSHTPDEYLTEAELEAGVAFYEKLLRAYFESAA